MLFNNFYLFISSHLSAKKRQLYKADFSLSFPFHCFCVLLYRNCTVAVSCTDSVQHYQKTPILRYQKILPKNGSCTDSVQL